MTKAEKEEVSMLMRRLNTIWNDNQKSFKETVERGSELLDEYFKKEKEDFARSKCEELRDRDVATILRVRGNYPVDIFPEESASQDALHAKTARRTCDNIEREIKEAALAV